MRAIRNILVAVALAALVAAPVLATEPGGPAPALKIQKWLKGQPVDLAAGRGKNVYVVEFWATWCGPCIRGMPHLSKLQTKYGDKGLVIIGVTGQDKHQDLEAVQEFLKVSGERMAYTVAYDQERETREAYMEAFKQRGIPHCFVIDKQGNIVWHGHPMFGLDEVLEAVLAGNSDVKKLADIAEKAEQRAMKEMRETQEAMEKYFELVGQSKNLDQKARELGEKAFKRLADNADGLNEFAWRILTDEEVQARDLELALKAAKAAYDASDGKNAAIADTYARALWDNGKKKDAIEMQKKAVKLAPTAEMREELEKTLKGYEEKAGGEK